MTDDLAISVARISIPRVDLDDASAAVEAIAAADYEFVSPGMPGATLDSELEFRALARYLGSQTQLSFAGAFGVIDAIAKIGFKIRKASTSISA